MENSITELRIKNFKSIKDVSLKPRRVNLIIGPPNVGKSNILEAMSLLGAPFDNHRDRFMSDFIRYESVPNLFYDNVTTDPIVVEASTGSVLLKARNGGSDGYSFRLLSSNVLAHYSSLFDIQGIENSVDRLSNPSLEQIIDELIQEQAKVNALSITLQADGRANRNKHYEANADALPKKYVFEKGAPHNQTNRYTFLNPPAGDNTLAVVQASARLRQDLVELIKPYGLQFVLRVADRKFEIQKNLDGFIYEYPYSLIADTLQRLIFYFAAIESNANSVLLLEEPEAHSYPVYVAKLGRRIVESRTNQFFVATHSPYLITSVLENMLPDEEQSAEIAVFATYYEDFQTKIRQLNDEEVRSIRADGLDVFYNMPRFTHG
jgi:predicted ATPase